MLEKIFGSLARVKILKIFLINSEEKFYIRQLSRDLKLQVNSVRRELVNLEEFGLLYSNDSIKKDSLSSEEGGDSVGGDLGGKDTNSDSEVEDSAGEEQKGLRDRKYYQVDKSFILFSELKSLFIKSQILSGEHFIEKLKMYCDPQFILLGGMFVNDTSAPTDVLIVADIDKDKLIKIIEDLEFELGREVNFTVMDQKEFEYRQEVADVFLHSVLNSRKIILVDKILNVN